MIILHPHFDQREIGLPSYDQAFDRHKSFHNWLNHYTNVDCYANDRVNDDEDDWDDDEDEEDDVGV